MKLRRASGSQQPAREAPGRVEEHSAVVGAPQGRDGGLAAFSRKPDPQVRQGGLASVSRRLRVAEFTCSRGDACAAMQERKRLDTRGLTANNDLIQFSVLRDSQTMVDQGDGFACLRGRDMSQRERFSRATCGVPRFIITAECHFQFTTIHSVLFQKRVRRRRQISRRGCCSGSVMCTFLWSLVTTHECLIVPLSNEACGQINIQITVSNGASFLCRCSTCCQDGRTFSR